MRELDFIKKFSFIVLALPLAAASCPDNISVRDQILVACQGYDKTLEVIDASWSALDRDVKKAVVQSVQIAHPLCLSTRTAPEGTADLESVLITIRNESQKILEIKGAL